MGHVPQRPLHRARHQGDRLIHVRALADRARVRHEGRPLTRPPGRAARARDGRDQGVGAGRRRRPACLLGAANRARDRCRADRSSCGARRQAARAGGSRPRSGRIGVQARACPCPGGHVSHRHRGKRRIRASRDRRMHRRRTSHQRCDSSRCGGRRRMSHGRRERRANPRAPDGRRGVICRASTTWWWAASTPTSGTGSLRVSSRVASHRSNSCAFSSGSRKTSRSSSNLPRLDRDGQILLESSKEQIG
jgi:hypothetical protein